MLADISRDPGVRLSGRASTPSRRALVGVSGGLLFCCVGVVVGVWVSETHDASSTWDVASRRFARQASRGPLEAAVPIDIPPVPAPDLEFPETALESALPTMNGVDETAKSVQDLSVAVAAYVVDSYVPKPQADGTLQEGESRSLAQDLEPGDYVVVARCGISCSDLDLSVTDAVDQVLVADRGGDDVPAVRFTIRAPQAVSVTVHMASCASTEPCRYSLSLLKR